MLLVHVDNVQVLVPSHGVPLELVDTHKLLDLRLRQLLTLINGLFVRCLAKLLLLSALQVAHHN